MLQGVQKGEAMTVHLGIEILLRERRELLAGARIGAVVHPASLLPSLEHSADALFRDKSLRLVALFGPQHGARGEKQDNMVESGFYLDPDTRLPVHSLYGETRWPTEEMMSGIDVMVYDLQDVGTRVYTFIYTLAYCMEACRRYGKRLVVADRPNPINGMQIEGNILDPAYASFVGRFPLPMRHGMTVGELALMFQGEFGIACDLAVVPMQGWRRGLWHDQTALPWIMPSPNLPTLDSATVYPGAVLVEGTLLSEGRGTTRPFELIGAPYIDARRLAARLNDLRLDGVRFRPVYFEPTFQKHAHQLCAGVQLHVLDRARFQPVLAGIAVLSAVRELHPDQFQWRRPPYEYEFDRMPIEILCGGSQIARAVDSGMSVRELWAGWEDDLVRFDARRRPFLLYD